MSKAIPGSLAGAGTGAQCLGEGLKITPTEQGALLHCAFQRLDGVVTREGLWLTSRVPGQPTDRFRLKAVAVALKGRPGISLAAAAAPGTPEPPCDERVILAATGEVSVEGQTVRFIRPGLVEEYSVSMDGMRQDFFVLEKPDRVRVPAIRLAGDVGSSSGADLCVELSVTGARVAQAAYGAQFILEQRGRKIAYSRLKVTDANGRELPARIEVAAKAEIRKQKAEMILVVVDDTEAVYPLRIDPTFSDADWVSLGPGIDNPAYALAVSGSNIYVGGNFQWAGGKPANYVAKWDGSTWSALGSGVNGSVNALAVSGSNVYAGGSFTMVGGIAANYIAKWDGSTWSALGSGVNRPVVALAVSGSDVYAGGNSMPNASYIARWDGSTWRALGSGLGRWDGSADSAVYALMVSGGNLYAGGWFTTAGGSPATNIAKWNGTAWSALGPGLGGFMFAPSPPAVYALAVSGSDLYAGGWFPVPDDSQPSFHVAKWNGSTWSALGSGLGNNSYAPGYAPSVAALTVSGSNLYAGGYFITAGGIAANYIAKWDGSTWSALGSGLNGSVDALAVLGSDLYAGGSFTMAGGKVSTYLAKAIIGPPPFYIATTNSSLSNGAFSFTLTGPAGSNAVIFASTNLQTWTPLVTNPLTGGSLNFTDTLATNFTRRFYRALLQP